MGVVSFIFLFVFFDIVLTALMLFGVALKIRAVKSAFVVFLHSTSFSERLKGLPLTIFTMLIVAFIAALISFVFTVDLMSSLLVFESLLTRWPTRL